MVCCLDRHVRHLPHLEQWLTSILALLPPCLLADRSFADVVVGSGTGACIATKGKPAIGSVVRMVSIIPSGRFLRL
jgi:hypothetical protein